MRIRRWIWLCGVLVACGSIGLARADGPDSSPGPAGSVRLEHAIPLASARRFRLSTTPLFCFEGFLSSLTNPGCFGPPAGAADCVSHSQHYFVQYLFPGVTRPNRLTAMGFVSNDAATVFPSAGAVLISYKAPNHFRYPTVDELTHLQAHNVRSAGDTTLVVIDLSGLNLTFADSVAIAVAVQFPEGGVLQDVGVGPGILIEDQLPDQRCDYLTTNGGVTWYEPAPSEHIDWGFEAVIEPTTGLENRPWSQVKALYR